MLPELSDTEALRYHRQIMLRGFDFTGQERLKASRVLLMGVGGLGCSVAQYLAAAGIGHLVLVDFDQVALSNLQRQILHTDARIGMAKVDSASIALRQINPHLTLSCYHTALDEQTLAAEIQQAQVVIDCTDNLPIREQLNRVCHHQRKPLISGAAIRMEGQISVFTYQEDEPCYHCLSHLFGSHVLTCAESGVMAPLVGTIGTLQAMEAIKLLTGFGEVARGRVLLFDAMTLQFRQLTLARHPHCDVCGGGQDESTHFEQQP